MWTLCPGQALRHHQWGTGCVLYNDLSGDTHHLDAAAMIVLLALRREPAPHDRLALILDATARETIPLLDQLARLALIERAC